MSIVFAVFGVLGFIFGLNAFVQVQTLTKPIATLESAQGNTAR